MQWYIVTYLSLKNSVAVERRDPIQCDRLTQNVRYATNEETTIRENATSGQCIEPYGLYDVWKRYNIGAVV